MTEFQPLAGKICLVTGATRGIGKGIALQLGQAGATVYITGEIYCLSIFPKLRLTTTARICKFYKCSISLDSPMDFLNSKTNHSSMAGI